tara:strand:- start:15581 stop:15796 length:216 start_codon:yes stop_codon:yes gene_type:complete
MKAFTIDTPNYGKVTIRPIFNCDDNNNTEITYNNETITTYIHDTTNWENLICGDNEYNDMLQSINDAIENY